MIRWRLFQKRKSWPLWSNDRKMITSWLVFDYRDQSRPNPAWAREKSKKSSSGDALDLVDTFIWYENNQPCSSLIEPPVSVDYFSITRGWLSKCVFGSGVVRFWFYLINYLEQNQTWDSDDFDLLFKTKMMLITFLHF